MDIRLAKFGYPSPPLAMKSFSSIVYVAAAVRSTAAPVHVPSAACLTAPVTRLPAAARMS